MASFDFHWYDLVYLVIGAISGWLSKLFQNIPQNPTNIGKKGPG